MTSLDQKVAAVDISSTNYLFVAALIFVRKVLLLFLFCHSASLRLCLHIIQKRTGRIKCVIVYKFKTPPTKILSW